MCEIKTIKDRKPIRGTLVNPSIQHMLHENLDIEDHFFFGSLFQKFRNNWLIRHDCEQSRLH